MTTAPSLSVQITSQYPSSVSLDLGTMNRERQPGGGHNVLCGSSQTWNHCTVPVLYRGEETIMAGFRGIG